MIDDLNATPTLAFVVHDGDLWGEGPLECSDERYADRFALFESLVHPLIYTPGDNDWTDCWNQRFRTSYDPLERLGKVREVFFSDEFSLGQRRIRLTRQSEDPRFVTYSENARWTWGGVTFLTLHLVGSNNNLGRTPEGDTEWAERTAANVAWLRAGFETARTSNSRGIAIVTQANPRFERPPEDRVAFNDVLDALREETIASGRPVLFVHGDTHYFRVDQPMIVEGFRPPAPGNPPSVGNFTRLETFGTPDHHWVRVTVDYADTALFVIRPKIVEQNLP